MTRRRVLDLDRGTVRCTLCLNLIAGPGVPLECIFDVAMYEPHRCGEFPLSADLMHYSWRYRDPFESPDGVEF